MASWVLNVVTVLVVFGTAADGRLAILLHGESFRAHSKQHSREVGVGGYAGQKEASLSQLLLLIHPLVFDGGESVIDLHVRTYASGFEADLRKWYEPYVSTFAVEPQNSPDLGTQSALRKLAAENTTYHAILLLRPDVIFKPLFTSAFLAADRSKIVFPFEVGPEMIRGKSVPRVSDMFVWIPRDYFSFARDEPGQFINNHHTYQYIESTIPGGVANLRFVLANELVDSDPEKMRNRIYRLANRPEFPFFDRGIFREGWENRSFGQTTVDAVLHNNDTLAFN